MQKSSHGGQPPARSRKRAPEPRQGTRGRAPRGTTFPSSLTFALTSRHEIISPVLGRKPRKASQAHLSIQHALGTRTVATGHPRKGFPPAPRALLGITPYTP